MTPPSRTSRCKKAACSPRAHRSILTRSIVALLPVVAAASGLAPVQAKAGLFYWSTTAGQLGGTGVWDTATPFWADASAASYQVWPNQADSVANFQGTPGTVHLGTTGLTAGGLTFKTNGFTIDNGGNGLNTLTLAGANPTITTGTGAGAAGVSASISANLSFGNWTKDGAGTLLLSGNNTASSQSVISVLAGVLGLGSPGALGGAAVSFGAGSNASLMLNGQNTTVSGLDGDASATVTNGAAANALLTVNKAAGSVSVFGGKLTDGGAGTLSLAKTGLGNLVLTNNGNTFSGEVSVTNGSLIISNPAQLGTGTSAISISGIANTGNPGFGGGQLVLNGGLDGMTLSREVSVYGRGPGATNNAGGLISIGNNTIAGHLVLGSTASQGNIVATHGITTITGNVLLGNSTTQTLSGNGNFVISGEVTGFEVANDRFAKSGTLIGTTLWLQNPNNSFAESVRIDSGTVRVSTNSALGLNTSTQAVDLNNGILEIRTDTPGVGNADFSTRKVFNRDNTNTGIFVGGALLGSAINQTVAFGETRSTGANTNFRVTGRDGFNTYLVGLNNSPTGIMGAGGANNALIENNSNGLLTLATSSLWNQTDGTARTLTVQGNGEILITGNITASGPAHAFTKAGTGTLTLQGTNSTFTGSASVNAGTLSIGTIGALNASGTGRVVFSGGTLNYTGAGET